MNEELLAGANQELHTELDSPFHHILKLSQTIRSAWRTRKESVAVKRTTKQIIDDLASAWQLEKPNFAVQLSNQSLVDMELTPMRISLPSKEKRYQSGQDIYVHEATHALLFQNNEKYRELNEQKFVYIKDLLATLKEQMKTGSVQTELLERISEITDWLCVTTTYEEMVASLTGHHLHQIPNQQEMREKKQLVIENIQKIRTWRNTYQEEYKPILRYPLGDVGKYMLEMKISAHIKFLENILYRSGQILGSILSVECPSLSVKNLIHMNPFIMKELLQVENQEQLNVFIQKITQT